MRNKYFLIAAIGLIGATTSCRSSKIVSTEKHVDHSKKDSSHVKVDTTKTQVIKIDQQQTSYGDTLTGSLQFTDEQITQMEEGHEEAAVDSIESNGVKVIVAVTKTGSGIKTKVTAVAKPKQVTNTQTTITNTQAGTTEATDVKTDHVKTDTATTKKVVGFPWGMACLIGAIVFLISFTLFLYKN